MVLGIDLTNDFAFKKTFGSPENSVSLISLLNSVLDGELPVETVEILNPFNYQEFADQKQVVLDVRCRDATRRWFNVEMQVAYYPSLLKRLTYYASGLYVDQLEKGQNYMEASQAVTVCFLRYPLFSDRQQAHHRFRLMDQRSGHVLADTLEVHTVELTKYNLAERRITKAPKIEQWAFLLMKAHQYSGESLRRLLPGEDFEGAIRTLERIAAKTEDKQMYDQRERAKRDYEWGLEGARAEGRAEGELVGKIVMLQEMLGDRVYSNAEFASFDLPALRSLLALLQDRFKNLRA